MKELSSILDFKKINGIARARIMFHAFKIKACLEVDESFKVEHENLICKMYPIVEYHLTYSIKNEYGDRIKKTKIEEIRIKYF